MNDEKPCPECGAKLPQETPEGLCPACLLQRGLETRTAGTGGAPEIPSPAPEALAGYFPQLEIVELLGRGGMGAVYKARHKGLDRWVALKILPAAKRNPAFAERFSREARALARLDHPNIVTVHDSGEVNGLFYFIMEYVDGANLRQVLAAGGITPAQALAIVPQICEALQYAHDQGIVHRDIKPENILIDKTGRVKIADFGIAKIVGLEARDFTLTGAGDVMGTPAYMAPEQMEHPNEVDHRADIYSLGVVFYQMLTGELPLGRFAPPSRKVHIDVRLDEVVLRALEKEPARRYQQAGEVKTEVETIAGTREEGKESLSASHGNKSHTAPLDSRNAYAGFWRRVMAVIIDYNIVAIAVFPIVLLIASARPERIVVNVPFSLFTSERIIDAPKRSEKKNTDGSITIEDQRIIEVTALGRWKYLYRETIKHNAGNEDKSRQLIDPVSRQEIHPLTAETINLWVLFFYWVIMESSRSQASFGKMLLGIQVVDEQGRRLSFTRALGRNLSKLLSIATLTVGFMMAGWTDRKQALHDLMARCYVTIRSGGFTVPTVKPSSRRGGLLLALGLLLLTLITTVGAFWTFKTHQVIAGFQNKVLGRFLYESSAPSNGSSFGPEMERDLVKWAMIDFDSDSQALISDELYKGVHAGMSLETAKKPCSLADWMSDWGMDAWSDKGYLTTFGMKVKALTNADWDQMSAPQVDEAIQSINPTAKPLLVMAKGIFGPTTYAFQTREGGKGILQITRITGNPPSVKIRYKMVRPPRQSLVMKMTEQSPIERFQVALKDAVDRKDKDEFLALVNRDGIDAETKADLQNSILPLLDRMYSWPGVKVKCERRSDVQPKSWERNGRQFTYNGILLLSAAFQNTDPAHKGQGPIFQAGLTPKGMRILMPVEVNQPAAQWAQSVPDSDADLLSIYGVAVNARPDTEDYPLTEREGQTETVHLEKSVLLDYLNVRSLKPEPNGNGGYSLRVTFDEEGTRKFAEITARRLDRRIGIVVDGKLLSAPVIKDPIFGGNFTVGNMTESEARDLASKLTRAIETGVPQPSKAPKPS